MWFLKLPGRGENPGSSGFRLFSHHYSAERAYQMSLWKIRPKCSPKMWATVHSKLSKAITWNSPIQVTLSLSINGSRNKCTVWIPEWEIMVWPPRLKICKTSVPNYLHGPLQVWLLAPRRCCRGPSAETVANGGGGGGGGGLSNPVTRRHLR
jgi:hypothetical protein